MPTCAMCGAAANPGADRCAACGAALPPAPRPAPGSALPPGEKPIDQTMAILALVLNLVIWPGLGSIIAGEKVGWTQALLNLLGLALVFTIIGIVIGVPLMVAMWIWGIVTGAQLIQRANAQKLAAGGAR